MQEVPTETTNGQITHPHRSNYGGLARGYLESASNTTDPILADHYLELAELYAPMDDFDLLQQISSANFEIPVASLLGEP